MRTLVRTVALAALIILVPAAAAPAAKRQKPAAWAKQHHLTGSWRAKDADKDGLKNLAEYREGTDPRKADTDRDGLKDGDEVLSSNDPLDRDTDGDGVKDGAEHAGVITKFDGETITIRQFNGGKLKATLADDAECGDPTAEDSGADGDQVDDGEWTGDGDDVAAASSSDEVDSGDEVDAGDSAYGGCDTDDIEPGTVLQSAEIERSGGETFVTALNFA